MQDIIIELQRATGVLVTGLIAIGIALASLAYYAEPAMKVQDLRNQESSVKW
jgi:preprotein translocase subunit SecG